MSTNIKLLWTLIIILFLIIVYFALQFLGVSFSLTGGGGYYAVYMQSGDIYFGELHRFPRLHLTDVYFLVQGKDDKGDSAFALQKFQSAVWGPSDLINLNNDNVLWMTPLKDDGGAMKAIRNGGAPPAPSNSLPSPATGEPLPETKK